MLGYNIISTHDLVSRIHNELKASLFVNCVYHYCQYSEYSTSNIYPSPKITNMSEEMTVIIRRTN